MKYILRLVDEMTVGIMMVIVARIWVTALMVLTMVNDSNGGDDGGGNSTDGNGMTMQLVVLLSRWT